MTHISRDDVAALATMSALQLADDEIDSLQTELSQILDYVEQLSELDTADTQPTYQVNGLSNVWRKDEVQPSLGRKELLALAPESADNQVKVPKVL